MSLLLATAACASSTGDVSTAARASQSGSAATGAATASGSGSTGAKTGSSSAATPAPARAECYRLSYTQALAPTTAEPPVACGRRHTAQTYLVGRLQTAVDGHLLAVDSDTVQREVAQTCPRRLATYLGGTAEQLRLSLLRAVWFTPTAAAVDAGASWFRCDVVAAYGTERLARLGPDTKDALATAATREDYAMCATDQPGTADFTRVPCGDPHTWRAIRTVDLSGTTGGDGRFPGLQVVQQGDDVDGEHLCADAARAIAADALDYQWGYEWPTRSQWRAGQDYGRCWAPDTGSSAGG